MNYFERQLGDLIIQTLETRPLVYLNGPRQVGKSTLAEHINLGKEINFVTFDSPLTLAAAMSDPVGFIKSLPDGKLNVVDEVQMAPEIFSQFKAAVDEHRGTGANKALFLLTGSANIMALPELASSLAGRMSVLTLLPFSAAEYHGTGKNFIDSLRRENLSYKKYGGADLAEAIANATYPEIALNRDIQRTQWFDDYLTATLQRDVKTLMDIRSLSNMVQLLMSLSQRVGSLMNNSAVTKEIGMGAKTYAKYKDLANNTFLTFEVEPWSKPNKLNKRFVRHSKLYFSDTNLLCYVMRRNLSDICASDASTMGRIFENFIATEIMKNVNSLPGAYVSHFNLSNGKEVDFVIEDDTGAAIGLEVKLNATLSEKDFANLKIFRETLDDQFKTGVVIYTGNELVPFGDGLWAVPVNYLWE